MLVNQPRRYQIPTHLDTPDKIDLPLFGITISLTMRQGVCFLLGGSAIFHLWEQSFGLVGIAGLMAHWIVPFLLTFLTYVIAVHNVRGRYLETWILVWLRYSRLPKVFVWRSVILHEALAPPLALGEPEPRETIDQLEHEEDEAA